MNIFSLHLTGCQALDLSPRIDVQPDEKTELTLEGFREWFPIIASTGALLVSAFAAYANVTTRLSLLETAYTGNIQPQLEAVAAKQQTVGESITSIRSDLSVLNQRVTTLEQRNED
jgi:hypothetical protein